MHRQTTTPRARWRFSRTSGSVNYGFNQGATTYYVRLRYWYFNDAEKRTLLERLGRLRIAVEQMAKDVGPVQAIHEINGNPFKKLNPIVQHRLRRWFGGGRDLTWLELKHVRIVIHNVRASLSNGSLRIVHSYDPFGTSAAWNNPFTRAIYIPRKQIANSWWNDPPKRQIGILFHELTHFSSGTGDYGYFDDSSLARTYLIPPFAPGPAGAFCTSSAMLTTAEFRPVAPWYERPNFWGQWKRAQLRTSARVHNADTYEGFLEDYYLDDVR